MGTPFSPQVANGLTIRSPICGRIKQACRDFRGPKGEYVQVDRYYIPRIPVTVINCTINSRPFSDTGKISVSKGKSCLFSPSAKIADTSNGQLAKTGYECLCVAFCYCSWLIYRAKKIKSLKSANRENRKLCFAIA